MHQNARLLSALLLFLLVQLGISIPTSPKDVQARALNKRATTILPPSPLESAPATAVLTPPALQTTPILSPAPLVSVTAPPPSLTPPPFVPAPNPDPEDPDANRTKCSPAECPQACEISNSTSSTLPPSKRFLDPPTPVDLDLDKRFFEIPSSNPGSFVIKLLKKSYTTNLSPDPTKYEWASYSPTRQYASALIGLSGCTAVFITSPRGMFSAHIWEEDTNTNQDLQPANYISTTSTLRSQIAAHRDDLAGGDAFIILPTKTGKKGTRLYALEIVAAILDAVRQGSGLEPQQQEYGPLSWDRSPGFGTYERGSAAGQYDPRYTDPGSGEVGPAVRLWSENRLMVERRYVS